jgi:acetyl-CoA synthetase
MRDYDAVYRNFSLDTLERQVLQGSLDWGLNACVECCDRWATDDRVAVEWIGRDGSRETLTFAFLQHSATRFANLLAACGIGRGDVVAGLLPRIPELLTVVLGTWRAGAVYQPLFTAFGPKAIEQRVTAAGGSQAKLIVSDAANGPKLTEVANCPAVLLVDRGQPAARDFADTVATRPATFEPVTLKGDDPFVVIFTSGTTGSPKGVRYPLRLLLPVAVYMIDGLDLGSVDHYWNVADPGWAYGMLYAVVGPLLLGFTTTMYEGPFSADSCPSGDHELGIWVCSLPANRSRPPLDCTTPSTTGTGAPIALSCRGSNDTAIRFPPCA